MHSLLAQHILDEAEGPFVADETPLASIAANYLLLSRPAKTSSSSHGLGVATAWRTIETGHGGFEK